MMVLIQSLATEAAAVAVGGAAICRLAGMHLLRYDGVRHRVAWVMVYVAMALGAIAAVHETIIGEPSVSALLLLAGAGGYSLARRALAPVDRMATQALQITAERLGDRLPVANPHDEFGRLAEAGRRLGGDRVAGARGVVDVLHRQARVAGGGQGLEVAEANAAVHVAGPDCQRRASALATRPAGIGSQAAACFDTLRKVSASFLENLAISAAERLGSCLSSILTPVGMPRPLSVTLMELSE